MNGIYIEHTDIGATLTTWLYTSFWQMYAAEQHGLRSYINWPRNPLRALRTYYDDKKFDVIPNMYDWYFVQPHFNTPPAKDDVWCWTEPSEMGTWLGEHQLYADAKLARLYFQKNLTFNDLVEARGEALRAKYNIDFANTIGVTWRGTDCVGDGRPYLPIETYFAFIDDVLKNDPGLRIACTAEEEGALDPLLARYPNAFRVEEFVMSPRGHKHNPDRCMDAPGFERGMQPALMVWLFSKCAHYVKNRSSVAAVASWLSNGRIVSIAHPENMGHDEESKKFAEIEGRRIQL